MYKDRNTRIPVALATASLILLVLGGVAFLLAFIFSEFESGGSGSSDGSGDFNWSILTIFITIFISTSTSIFAVIHEQKRKQAATSTVQNQPFEKETEQQVQEHARKQVDRSTKPSFVSCRYCGEKMNGIALFCPQCGTEMKSLR